MELDLDGEGGGKRDFLRKSNIRVADGDGIREGLTAPASSPSFWRKQLCFLILSGFQGSPPTYTADVVMIVHTV